MGGGEVGGSGRAVHQPPGPGGVGAGSGPPGLGRVTRDRPCTPRVPPNSYPPPPPQLPHCIPHTYPPNQGPLISPSVALVSLTLSIKVTL